MSFDRWMTETTSTLAIPNATDRPTNRRISVLAISCALTAVKNCALVLIQLSALNACRRLDRLGDGLRRRRHRRR